jgi:hypothetical protein
MLSSILQRIWLHFTAFCKGLFGSLQSYYFGYPNYLVWASLKSYRNANLVHQNWYPSTKQYFFLIPPNTIATDISLIDTNVREHLV